MKLGGSHLKKKIKIITIALKTLKNNDSNNIKIENNTKISNSNCKS